MTSTNTVTVEIYVKTTGEVLTTKEVELKSWNFYWTRQCNDQEYGWRIKKNESEHGRT